VGHENAVGTVRCTRPLRTHEGVDCQGYLALRSRILVGGMGHEEVGLLLEMPSRMGKNARLVCSWGEVRELPAGEVPPSIFLSFGDRFLARGETELVSGGERVMTVVMA
jgi:hypothetical protein